MPVLALNKKASFDYEFLEKYEAGIVLTGSEVKSAKSGQINLKGSYISIANSSKGTPEIRLVGAHISPYKYASNQDGYDPKQSRKLLLKHREIMSLVGKQQEKGLTFVPIKIYTKGSLVKLEFVVAKGKKKYNKKEAIKKKDIERDVQREFKVR
jgi:SsrA-binding protein